MIEGKNTILFDMDGVLVDSELQHYEAWNEVFQELGFTVPWDVYKPNIGRTLVNLFKIVEDYVGYPLKDHDALLDNYKEKLDRLFDREGYKEIPGVKEIIPKLKDAGYHIAVASSSPVKEIERTIRHVGLEGQFEILYSGENARRPKPWPDPFLECAKLIGSDPASCIVVEDSYNGSLAGKRAGMMVIGIQNPGSGDQDLSNADIIIDKFSELEGILL